jgi:hypothetical protein
MKYILKLGFLHGFSDRMGHSNFQIDKSQRNGELLPRPDPMSKGPPSQPVCPRNHAYQCLNNPRYARQLKQSILNGAQISYD